MTSHSNGRILVISADNFRPKDHQKGTGILTDGQAAVIEAVAGVALAAPLCTLSIPIAKVGAAQCRDHFPSHSRWTCHLQGSLGPVLQQPPLALVLQVRQQGLLPAQIVLELQVQDTEMHRLLQAASQQPPTHRANSGVGQSHLTHLQSLGRAEATRGGPLGLDLRSGLCQVILGEKVSQVLQSSRTEALSSKHRLEIKCCLSPLPVDGKQMILPELAV